MASGARWRDTTSGRWGDCRAHGRQRSATLNTFPTVKALRRRVAIRSIMTLGKVDRYQSEPRGWERSTLRSFGGFQMLSAGRTRNGTHGRRNESLPKFGRASGDGNDSTAAATWS